MQTSPHCLHSSSCSSSLLPAVWHSLLPQQQANLLASQATLPTAPITLSLTISLCQKIIKQTVKEPQLHFNKVFFKTKCKCQLRKFRLRRILTDKLHKIGINFNYSNLYTQIIKSVML